MSRSLRKRRVEYSNTWNCGIEEIDVDNLEDEYPSETYIENSRNEAIDPHLDVADTEIETKETTVPADASTTDNITENKTKKKEKRLNKIRAAKNREIGIEYVGYRRIGSKIRQDIVRPARKPGPACSSEFCNKNCSKFSENERSFIFKHFWKMNWSQKKDYVSNLIRIHHKKNTPRSYQPRTYFLPKSDYEKFSVCQLMFFNTLSVKEKMVRIWLKSKLPFGFFEHPTDVQKRKNMRRREHETYQEIQKRKNLLRQFFVDYPKLESHYCRKDSDKLYFQTEHRTITDIYREYAHFCEQKSSRKLSIPIFSNTMNKLKFSIFKPKKDQCDTCTGHRVGNLSDIVYQRHRDEVRLCAKEKEKDVADATKHLCIVLCMDVEAVQLCPKILASMSYFKMKLQIHNFTIYDLASHKSTNYVWDESEGELKASIFTTIVIQHVENLITQNLNGKPIIIYDGCGYQNRNAILSSALYHLARRYPSVKIVQKFLIKGHTHMEVDSTHALIERQTRGLTINLPTEFVAAVLKARINPFPLEVKHLDHSFFLNYEDVDVLTFKSITPGTRVGDPTVNELRCLEYTRDGILFKLSFGDEFEILPRDGVENPLYEPKRLYDASLPISATKYKHLNELKAVLPAEAHNFYTTLKYI